MKNISSQVFPKSQVSYLYHTNAIMPLKRSISDVYGVLGTPLQYPEAGLQRASKYLFKKNFPGNNCVIFIWGALRDVVPSVQFEKTENTHGWFILLLKLQTEVCHFPKKLYIFKIVHMLTKCAKHHIFYQRCNVSLIRRSRFANI